MIFLMPKTNDKTNQSSIYVNTSFDDENTS